MSHKARTKAKEKRMRKRGSDLRYDLEISLKQAGEGLTTMLTVSRGDRESESQIKVPAGVDTGSLLRLGGKGESGIGDGELGDLYVVIRVSEHESFKRKGSNLYTKVGISPEQLERGDQILIETLLDGSKYLDVPANTKEGAIFRMQGLGMPSLLKGRGDLYVKLACRH
jgi:DnaJ-class molecular chaperone